MAMKAMRGWKRRLTHFMGLGSDLRKPGKLGALAALKGFLQYYYTTENLFPVC